MRVCAFRRHNIMKDKEVLHCVLPVVLASVHSVLKSEQHLPLPTNASQPAAHEHVLPPRSLYSFDDQHRPAHDGGTYGPEIFRIIFVLGFNLFFGGKRRPSKTKNERKGKEKKEKGKRS